jgi:hypothetical protein
MSEITITLTIPDSHLRDVLVGLAEFSQKFGIPNLKVATKTEVGNNPSAAPVQQNTNEPRSVAASEVQKAWAPAAPLLRDHFQRDRNGNEPRLAPDGAELQTISIVQVKKVTKGKSPFVGVLYEGGKANCFDPQLWPLLPQSGPVQVWIAESSGYLNIVGVRA